MATNLEALETWAAMLLARLEPGERSKLARSIGQELRRSQQKRVVAQENPDGTKFAPRKKRDLRGKQGRIRSKLAMFQKLRTVKYLKVRGDSNAITVGFTGRIARIARVHQYGLKDRAERGAPDVRYDQREVLGFSESDIDLIRDSLLTHLTT
ncbi:MAG: phage virion morphogenesis protein [Pseudomonas sp.]|jgi:phage virion morphogenesis protein|uniref:phage virion morphogenesis protein n=1 Tax=Pseudomonas sp. TaxID=306 RepID=UPI00239C3D86|nr:phage virion morphogenesis protein [Pseudomonas sp.]MDP9031506.1 phage virion morphogenesis protein [Pseudomonadota bacterium]MDE1910739.1 phage virion morphogenesis protein [Pseudomonas sp.]MDE2035365.1 phage virion morphogenesis protein [Pseudomonas sp.]MDE2190000.1 phage virion morphogenesis protein [Pseudomonas sp.]MDE2555369.1 phage virion morphogenesis protein [Pseudomonas sp.]